MSWVWLTELPALSIAFIATLIGLPASAVMDVQLIRSAVRKMARRRAEHRERASVAAAWSDLTAAELAALAETTPG